MASKIDQIEIQNFKYFPKLINPIEVNGKHMLLYGENGSGKSSIYWALYTLLEAANKEDAEEIKKYFDPESDEKLLNINLEQGSPNTPEAYVKIKLLDNAEFNVSFIDTTINRNTDAQASNYSSDFINYRHLLNLYNFSHSEEIDIFHFFSYAVLPYVKLNPITYWHKKKDETIVELTTTNANQIYDFVKKGPKKNVPTEEIGKFRFPKKGEKEFDDFKKIVEAFDSGLEELILYINTEGNPILNNEIDGLGYDLKFKLILDKEKRIKTNYKSFNTSNSIITEVLYRNDNPELLDKYFYDDCFILTLQQYEQPRFHIWLKIIEYEGKANVVKRAHSFLNEAKLTAVALAIRLAILKKTLEQDDAKLKLLVFDDLMISLDMSNREKIMKLILNKYIKEYQVFILTHDKVLFEDTKRHIETHYLTEIKRTGLSEAEKTANMTEVKKAEVIVKNDWILYEMYQASNDSYSFPFLTEHKSSIQKALYYFKENVDYNACGNNIRTALEEFFREFIPYNYFRDEDNNPIPVTDKTLGKLVEKAKIYFSHLGFSQDPLLELERYLSRSLNPLSHFNPTSNYYRKELEDIFQIYYKLNHLRNKPLLEKNSILKFDVNTTNGTKYTYSVQLMDDIRAYNENTGNGTYILETTDKRKYGLVSILTDNTTLKEYSGDTPFWSLKEFYEDTLKSIRKKTGTEPIVEPNLLKVFYNEYGVSLLDLLNRQ
jgi:energy-coupling factor transporter ATP-binding protein EcfA2